jgi:hypothetical protein
MFFRQRVKRPQDSGCFSTRDRSSAVRPDLHPKSVWPMRCKVPPRRYTVPIVGTTKHLETGYRARRNTLYALTWLTLTMSGCTNAPIPRMNSNFNAQSSGAPQQFPTPSPPNDQFIWLSQQPVNSVVAANPSGGNWVLTVAKPAFLMDPDVRHQFLLASSEPFTTSHTTPG